MISINTNSLGELEAWLNVELPGVVLFGLSFFYNLAFYIFLGVALIFTPLLLIVLFSEKRYGWAASLCILVLLPSIVLYYLMGGGSPGEVMLARTVPIGLYVFYCYTLKVSIPEMKEI